MILVMTNHIDVNDNSNVKPFDPGNDRSFECE